jgi:glycosyltransferase involved in cell wall biosynthesis
VGGAGVQRAAKFVRFLPDFGFEVLVLTGPGPRPDRWTPTDDSLVSNIPDQTRVIRTSGSAPRARGRWGARAERWLQIPSRFSRWWIREASRVGIEHGTDTDIVVATMSPFESAIVAAKIAETHRIPWVADLRDPWALDEMTIYPSWLHRKRAMRVMRRALASAAAIAMNTPEAAKRLRAAFPELSRAIVTVIPNGWDADDFAGPPPSRSDGAFRIVHTGYLHTDLGLQHQRRRRLRRLLGGEIVAVDILTRSHVFLLQALERLPASTDVERVELHLLGLTTIEDETSIRGSRIPVHFHGFTTHADAVSAMRSADLLFLPMHDLAPGQRATIVPGKTYEYLAAQRPILAAVPGGDARDLLLAAGNAYVCRPNDVAAMTDAIARELDRIATGTPIAFRDNEVVERFERRRLTAELADLLDRVLAPPPSS